MKLNTLRYFDWESIIKALVFLLIVGGYFYFRVNSAHFASKFVQRGQPLQASAILYERTPLIGNHQSFNGNTAIVNGITIKFQYNISGKAYYGRQLLQYSLIDSAKLNFISTAQLPCKIIIRYNEIDPQNASISLN